MQKPFATRGTEKKLKTVSDYLKFYTTALSARFTLTYFDGFAGSGSIPLRAALPLVPESADIDDFVVGSARRALQVSPSFDRYRLIDAKAQNTRSLLSLRDEFPHLADRILVEERDANTAVREFCVREMRTADRCVMFLDPFGNQVRWDTIELIGRTNGIDLWYLFPSGLGVLRQISRDGNVQADAERSLDLMFGPNDWRSNLILRERQRDLFGDEIEVSRRVESADAVTRYMIRCMQGVFRGRVLEAWLPLGKAGGHWYSLIFAWSNPKATDLASSGWNPTLGARA